MKWLLPLLLLSAPSSNQPTIRELVVETAQEVNLQRHMAGRARLVLKVDLCVYAQLHANWMARENRFEHSFGPYSEIIAVGQRTPAEAVSAWMDSWEHRSAMLDWHPDNIGVGHQARNGKSYWVCVFQSRRPASWE